MLGLDLETDKNESPALQKDFSNRADLRTTPKDPREHTVRPTRVKKIMSDHKKVWKVRGSLKHSH